MRELFFRISKELGKVSMPSETAITRLERAIEQHDIELEQEEDRKENYQKLGSIVLNPQKKPRAR